MTIPGTNMEAEEPIEPISREPGGDPAGEHDEEDDDSLIPTVTVGAQQMVPVGELIKHRRESKAAKKSIAELTEKVKWAEGVNAKLQEMGPTLELIRQNPKLVDEVRQGTRASSAATLQPKDDLEAHEFAEDYGLILPDGGLDIVRSRRMIDRLDQRAAAIADRRMAPVRQHTVEQVSAGHKAYAKTVTLKDGSRAASDESIEQAFAMLPAELTADKNVAALIPILAAGLDLFTGRKARAAAVRDDYDEPLLTEAPAGRRGPAALSEETRRILDRTGLSEKDYRSSEKAYVPGRPMRLE